MKWTKIKSIMICFLIVMNLFMLMIISITTLRDSVIPDKVVDASLKALSEEGFECDKDIFPNSYYTLPTLSAEFYSASELSHLFFGRQLAFSTSEKALIATENDSTLTVTDSYFSYESGSNADKSHSAGKIKRELHKMGFNMEGAVYDKKEGFFYKMYNNTNLFNMYISAKLDSDGKLCHITAQWPKKVTAQKNNKISFISSIMNLNTVFPNGGKIKNIEPGYNLNSIGGEKFTFTPAWRVQIGKELKILE